MSSIEGLSVPLVGQRGCRLRLQPAGTGAFPLTLVAQQCESTILYSLSKSHGF
jgi:hypothetical protein